MKKNLLFVFSFVLWVLPIGAQNIVTLSINHKLAGADFEMNLPAKNNLDHDFNVTRLEYYISEISLVHDSGSETIIEDLWILVSADEQTQVELGDYDITTIEKVRFHIGVDPDHNHLDPATYVSTHPLAPKSPSMHWGWTPGYRFVAIEGNGGSALNQLFQLHGLGDKNYFMTEIDVNVSVDNNVIRIALDADYTRALDDIAVNSGVVVHGEEFEAQDCVVNFGRNVFSLGTFTSSTIDFSEVKKFNVFPNPIVNGISTLELELYRKGSDYDLTITTLQGKQLQYLRSVNNEQQINLSGYATGMYLINLIKEGESIISNKIMVK